ncbi:ATP-binding protein [Mycobacterium simiae]|uniref:ATP-binding protein n=1 Tax=Mycobacterium simiae TaxID=1784 RepID=UPI0026362DB4|nr:ATP-binding protein [Mycobacterium simiae]
MSAPPAAAPVATENAQVFSGIRDIDTHIGEAAPGQRWPGGPYRPPEWIAAALIGVPTLWWIDSHEAGTTLPALIIGATLCVLTVVAMRLLLPKGRPSLSARIRFARNMFRPPHVTSAAVPGGDSPPGVRVDPGVNPPERVHHNLVFTRGGVYAEFLIEGLPTLMRSYQKHQWAAKQTRNLGRYLPSGSMLRMLLVAEDKNTILRSMVGSHAGKPGWVTQCRHWEPIIANPTRTAAVGYPGPVRARFWLTVPVDSGTAGRTPLGQGKRMVDWISGRDKESEKSLAHYADLARTIAQSLPNEFGVRPATPAQIRWYYAHRTQPWALHQPMPSTHSAGPTSLTRNDFTRAAFDEGDNAGRPWWRPSCKPMLRVYDPQRPTTPACYQTFLTVEHFPDQGVRFPRASYLHALLNVQTQAVIEWSQHLYIRTPKDAQAVNYRYTKNIKDQMQQRGPRGNEDDELPKKLSKTRRYSAQLNSNPAERELDHTVVIAVSAHHPDILDDAVKQIRQELDTAGIAVARHRGAQLLLWKAFNTGSETLSPLDEFRNPTTAHLWSLFLPLISARVGNVKGSPLAVDQTTMRPSVILHDPEGTARRNKNTGLAIVGDPGGGKSNRAKLSALELILRGARIVAFEPDTIAEWAKALRSVPGARFIDPTVGRWCFDPLVICHPHEAARLAAAHILPWIGVSADSLTAKRYRRLLRPDNRTRNGIRNHRDLMNYLRAQPDHEHDELLLRLETAEEDFPGFFDPQLPPYRPYDAPATVYLTGNLALPDAEDIANEQLYLKLSGPQRAGMAIYGLLIDIERQYMFDHPDRFDVMIFEECAQLLAYPAGARTAHLITRRGRKHATGIWFITQDFRDLARMGDKFVTQKWIFRIQDPELAYLTLQWARIDPDMYPELVVTLCDDTSPGNTRDEDILDDCEGSPTSVAEAGAVDPDRLGEGFLIDELGRAARVQFFGAPTAALARDLDSTAAVAP